jgi:hypothetical protein
VPANNDRKRSKIDMLREEGALNPAPEKVPDPKSMATFSIHDVVQVKYEMLRRVSVEKASVTEASDEYGVSRPTCYQTREDFEEGNPPIGLSITDISIDFSSTRPRPNLES